ncbi:MAG TPA: DUF4124 domain-containing protein [Steroidobacteraceae bacterium]|nr:DUF4124 domain-containing protein [Steroidobacteraceae bacterium]
MRSALILLTLTTSLALANSEVWRWVDSNGVVHFSDRPVPGAEKVQLNVQTFTPPPRPAPRSNPPAAETGTETREYRSLEIWKPAHDEAIVNTAGAVSVRMRLEPGLANDHSIFVYLNGQRVDNQPLDALDVQLNEVPRGTHTLTAVVTDSQGNTLIQAPPVVFHVVQASIANPPVGPALRPQPKPRGAAPTRLPSGALQPSFEELDRARRGIPVAPEPKKSVGPRS